MESKAKKTPVKRINKLIECSYAIESQTAKEAESIVYLPKSLIQTTIPHSKVKGNDFERKNGEFTLTMISHPNWGLPYGTYPRLFMAWLAGQIKKKNSTPTLKLGPTFSHFLKIFNLSKSGGKRSDASRIRNQIMRLITTQISFVRQNNKKRFYEGDQFLISESFKFWRKPNSDKNNVEALEATIELSDKFYCEIKKSAVPLDFRVLKALSRSPLEIDIYSWLTYRFYTLKKPTLIYWHYLKNQFGANYADNGQGKRDFKRHFLKSLRIVKAMYPTAKAQIETEGLLLMPSPTHVAKKRANLS